MAKQVQHLARRPRQEQKSCVANICCVKGELAHLNAFSDGFVYSRANLRAGKSKVNVNFRAKSISSLHTEEKLVRETQRSAEFRFHMVICLESSASTTVNVVFTKRLCLPVSHHLDHHSHLETMMQYLPTYVTKTVYLEKTRCSADC